ncbi:MAG: RNA-binding protein [Candidatus Harrisonbacteria bacterium CG10_big_fil_rev_8_21_14_0_10_44_23]|uniref:RNA-binding protein KhpA n=1 Tax=Candidatus Harrisonbacteria bacterium CG10_big_fil_rev_8_21_14_0_10_44_23 TaxID=1974585 RepID=A0A2H0UPW8_9BACT|nr:MAG: RNA-binding protein [Candidatus Harrisonbacteria bacterium CG10_big_fil_rev_8_21_14_0_10_44_23]
MEEKDQVFLEYLVKNIVDHPESVQVERKVDEMGVLLTLKVHPEDMGQVVGRQGATARSIRTLLRIVGIKSNARVNLKIEEPEGSTRGPRAAAPEAPAVAPAEEPDPIADEIKL